MVVHKIIIALAIFTVFPMILNAQKYDVTDTVTEYPMKGTYYHNKFEGRKTASGEIFNQNLFTAAHWRIKKGTYVLVTNQNTGLQVIVKINDRCPRRGVLDMTRRAANGIGIKGCQPVTVRILPEGYEELCEAQDAKFDSVYSRLATGNFNIKNTPKKNSNTTKQYYNLIIGTSQTHGEAFEMISKLPAKYQDKAIVDSVTENDFTITLEVKLPQSKANELCRSLKQTFSNCQVTPVE